MKVGWVGLGRLGAPCAAALAYHGKHDVVGFDVRGVDAERYDWAELPSVSLAPSVADVVEHADVVFVAVQTPHARDYGGERFAPATPREFEYGYLRQAVWSVTSAALTQRKSVTLVVVSTVLPGTFDRELRPLLNDYVTPVYHPFFIAMGTVVQDFVNPEMTLFGVDVPGDEASVCQVYETLHSAPAPVVSIASAELAKVAYNTFISAKIVFANTLAQLADATGADVDEVTDALALGTDRLLSPRYLRAGMGDGGACHPRDNIALSAIARRHDVEDFMGYLTLAREAQTRWLADIVLHWASLANLPVTLLGKSYKPHLDLVDGSPALLLRAALEEVSSIPIAQADPYVDPHYDESRVLARPQVFVVATRHDDFASLDFPVGSVVIDPFGYVNVGSHVTLVTPGRHRPPEKRSSL